MIFGSISNFLEHARPREISLADDKIPIIVFTDAAAEQQAASYGILIIDRLNRFVAGASIPQPLVNMWLKEVGTQVICQAELYPILLAKYVWLKQFSGRRILFFIDNDPARFGLIKTNSESAMSHKLIKEYYLLEAVEPSVSWFARVASQSNPADMPSRGKVREASVAFSAEILDLAQFDQELNDRLAA